MRIYHPQVPFQGLPQQNVFFVDDSVGVQRGMGTIIPFYQAELFPQQPMNFYTEIKAPDRFKHLLLGGILARAMQIIANSPNTPSRIYTQVSPNDSANLSFWEQNGFVSDDAEDQVSFETSFIPKRLPLGCSINSIPLATIEQQDGFVRRLNQYRISHLDIHFLNTLMRQPHFIAIAVYKGREIVAELLLSGYGDTASLISLYVKSPYRRMGIGKTLLHRGLTVLSAQGVQICNSMVLRRSLAQTAFAKSLNASFIRTTCFYPGMDLNMAAN